MASKEIYVKFEKALEYIKKVNERFLELKDRFEEERRAILELISLLINDLMELRRSLEKIFDKYIELVKKTEEMKGSNQL